MIATVAEGWTRPNTLEKGTVTLVSGRYDWNQMKILVGGEEETVNYDDLSLAERYALGRLAHYSYIRSRFPLKRLRYRYNVWLYLGDRDGLIERETMTSEQRNAERDTPEHRLGARYLGV